MGSWRVIRYDSCMRATDDHALAACVREALQRHLPTRPVQGVVVFGSRASDRARSDSDLDLGVLFEPRPGEPDRLAMHDAAQDIASIVHADVDLVDLRHARTTLALEALMHGRPLPGSDRSALFDHEIVLRSRHAEWGFRRKELGEHLFRRLGRMDAA